MKQTVYIETTIISYLASWPSRQIIRAAQQKITKEWWQSQRKRFELFSSQLVIVEATAGNKIAARDRLRILAGIRLADVDETAARLAKALLVSAALPAKAGRDALHVAIAATNGIDYLLTWNCTHLANAALRDKIDKACELNGVRSPIIATPEQLFAEE